jgi:hypothetical protein
MTNKHPITPPLELVAKWASSMFGYYQAAQWGADQELEACCALMDDWGLDEADLRAARRPKPPSLKEEALERLELAKKYIDVEPILRALKALPE